MAAPVLALGLAVSFLAASGADPPAGTSGAITALEAPLPSQGGVRDVQHQRLLDAGSERRLLERANSHPRRGLRQSEALSPSVLPAWAQNDQSMQLRMPGAPPQGFTAETIMATISLAEEAADRFRVAKTNLQRAESMVDVQAAIVHVGMDALGGLANVTSFVLATQQSTYDVRAFTSLHLKAYAAKLEALLNLLNSLPSTVSFDEMLSTYVEDRGGVIQAVYAFATSFKSAYDPLNWSLADDQCRRSEPWQFVRRLFSSLSPDGKCDVPRRCWLAAEDGLPRHVRYSPSEFMRWAAIMVWDDLIAADLALACDLLSGSPAQDRAGPILYMKATMVDTMLNLDRFYTEQMTHLFWGQVRPDVLDGLRPAGSNEDAARAIQTNLTAKYGHVLAWTVAIWDGVTGSLEQGFQTNFCGSTAQPDPRCTDEGGSIGALRVQTDGGPEKSYVIWFRPAGAPSEPPDYASAATAAGDACTSYFAGGAAPPGARFREPPPHDLVGLAECLAAALGRAGADSRGTLCLPAHSQHGASVQGPAGDVAGFEVALGQDLDGLGRLDAAQCWTMAPKSPT